MTLKSGWLSLFTFQILEITIILGRSFFALSVLSVILPVLIVSWAISDVQLSLDILLHETVFYEMQKIKRIRDCHQFSLLMLSKQIYVNLLTSIPPEIIRKS